MRPILAALCLAAGTANAAPPGAPSLSLPVDCALGLTCHIQNYADRDPGSGAVDHTCGSLTYDGHNGTDFRLRDMTALFRGTDVLAAAPGIVTATRDGVPDVALGAAGAPDIRGRECGNAVIVSHPQGWRTQYCHLREGSLTVERGDPVARGQVLGEIGLSGATEFPHLHFAVRDGEGRVIDPFDARAVGESCRFEERETLWDDPAISYTAGGVLTAGILDRLPDYQEVKDGIAARTRLTTDADAVVFWVHFFGLSAGDRLQLEFTGPEGEEVARHEHVMPRARATEYRAVGRRMGADAGQVFPPGLYRGVGRLVRDDREIDRIEAFVRVDPVPSPSDPEAAGSDEE
ncbi:MAG: M23 family metallopeptidase [Paracoccaceae bacterium]